MTEEENEEDEEDRECEESEDSGDGDVGCCPIAWFRLDCGRGLGEEVVVFCWCRCHYEK